MYDIKNCQHIVRCIEHVSNFDSITDRNLLIEPIWTRNSANNRSDDANSSRRSNVASIAKSIINRNSWPTAK